MPGMHTLYENVDYEIVGDTQDIGAGNYTSKYLDMTNYGTAEFKVQLGDTFEGTPANWNAADSLDNFYLLQATDADGTDAKIISGANLDQTDAQVGTADNRYVITVNTEAMDVANGFTHVAAYVAEDTGTGTDNVTILGARLNPRFSHANLGITTDKHTVV